MSPGEQIMDFSHIDDVVEAYMILIYFLSNKSDKIKTGDVFFLENTERYSLKRLSEIFKEVTQREVNVIFFWGYKKREVMNLISS